jgi:hypothetical protein
MASMEDAEAAFAHLASKFGALQPNGEAVRRVRENRVPAAQDRQAVLGRRVGSEIRNAQLTFKVRPSLHAWFFRAAQGYGCKAIVLFEAMISFARLHEAEFRAHLAQEMAKDRRRDV